MYVKLFVSAKDGCVDAGSVEVRRHEGKVPTREFLDAHPDCTYTTLVTMSGRRRAVRGTQHGARVGLSSDALCKVLASVRDGLESAPAGAPAGAPLPVMAEMCVVIIRTSQTQVQALGYMHGGVGSAGAGDGVCVDVHGAPREDPQRKATNWSVLRRAIESARREDARETLLVGDGSIYEGTVTNVYFVRDDGAVVTAPGHLVLQGTLRNVVLEACKDMNRKVVLECAKVEDLPSYQAAFLTNVARGVQFINRVWIGDKLVTYNNRNNVDLIASRVREMLENEGKKF